MRWRSCRRSSGTRRGTRLTRRANKVMHSKTVLAFSDCLVISVPVRSPLADHQGSFDLLMEELNNLDCPRELRSAWHALARRVGSRLLLSAATSYQSGDDPCLSARTSTPRSDDRDNAGASEIPRQPSAPTLLQRRHPSRSDNDPAAQQLPQTERRSGLSTMSKFALETVEGRSIGDEAVHATREAMDVERDRMRTEIWERACRDWARDHAQADHEGPRGSGQMACREKYVWLPSTTMLKSSASLGAKQRRFCAYWAVRNDSGVFTVVGLQSARPNRLRSSRPLSHWRSRREFFCGIRICNDCEGWRQKFPNGRVGCIA